MFKIVVMRFLESYFRHRWLYLIPIILTFGAGIYYVYKSPREYVAQSAVYVQNKTLLATLTALNTQGFSWMSPAQLTYGEIREMMQTDSFIRAVIQKTDLEAKMNSGPAAVDQMILDVRKAVWAIPSGDNQIIIGATNQNPQVAVQLTNSVFNTYINWKFNSANTNTDVAQGFFDNLIPSYKSNVDAIRQQLLDYLAQHPQPLVGPRPDIEQVEVARINSDLQIAENRYEDALSKLENAKLAAMQNQSDISQTYVMVDAPSMPDKPTTSLKKMGTNVMIFIAIGLLVSIVAIAASSIFDRTFRFPLDVQQRLSLPVLAMIPDTTPSRRGLAIRKLKEDKEKEKSKGKGKTKGFDATEPVPGDEIAVADLEVNSEDIDIQVSARS